MQAQILKLVGCTLGQVINPPKWFIGFSNNDHHFGDRTPWALEAESFSLTLVM